MTHAIHITIMRGHVARGQGYFPRPLSLSSGGFLRGVGSGCGSAELPPRLAKLGDLPAPTLRPSLKLMARTAIRQTRAEVSANYALCVFISVLFNILLYYHIVAYMYFYIYTIVIYLKMVFVV